MTAAIVLAAGTASRMGSLKQLLPYQGQPLVMHAVRQAVDAGFAPVVLVVGAEAKEVRRVVPPESAIVIENEQWRSGMGSSIAAGARHLQTRSDLLAAVAVTLADQPLVTAAHLRAMRRHFSEDPTRILAASYHGKLGVPALFPVTLLDTLAALDDAFGARAILRDPAYHAASFPLPEAAVDIDTPEDFAALRQGCLGVP